MSSQRCVFLPHDAMHKRGLCRRVELRVCLSRSCKLLCRNGVVAVECDVPEHSNVAIFNDLNSLSDLE